MKVNFNNASESINFKDIDTTKGIIITQNPAGVIMDTSGGAPWYFYIKSTSDWFEIESDDMDDFIATLLRRYPNIKAEYIRNEI